MTKSDGDEGGTNTVDLAGLEATTFQDANGRDSLFGDDGIDTVDGGADDELSPIGAPAMTSSPAGRAVTISSGISATTTSVADRETIPSMAGMAMTASAAVPADDDMGGGIGNDVLRGGFGGRLHVRRMWVTTIFKEEVLAPTNSKAGSALTSCAAAAPPSGTFYYFPSACRFDFRKPRYDHRLPISDRTDLA